MLFVTLVDVLKPYPGISQSKNKPTEKTGVLLSNPQPVHDVSLFARVLTVSFAQSLVPDFRPSDRW